jgi:hypothetical protein
MLRFSIADARSVTPTLIILSKRRDNKQVRGYELWKFTTLNGMNLLVFMGFFTLPENTFSKGWMQNGKLKY